MKTMKKSDSIIRVNDSEVEDMKKEGYNLCGKEEWKKKVRDIGGKKVEIKGKKEEVEVVERKEAKVVIKNMNDDIVNTLDTIGSAKKVGKKKEKKDRA